MKNLHLKMKLGMKFAVFAKLMHRGFHRVLYIILSPYRLFKFLCFVIGFFVLFSFVGGGIFFYSFWKSLPEFENRHFSELKQLTQKLVLKKMKDKKKPYDWTSLDQINKDYLYAIVMSEDGTFFEHEGINYGAIADALAENIRKRRYVSGASTISQQVVKNLFLSNRKTLVRKLREVLITTDLEKHFTKNQILELYLNLAEFGPDVFGVGMAADVFFQKKPSEINAAEGAFIALMLPAPARNYYSVYQNRNLTFLKKRKMRRILRDMLHFEFISEDQYRQYLQYSYPHEKKG